MNVISSFLASIATGMLAIVLLLQAVATIGAGDLVDGLVRYATHDHARAIEVLRPLADQGDAVAQEILGKIYSAGALALRDNFAAFVRFEQAAEQGRAGAQIKLGEMYRDGVGTSADGNLAQQWFQRAANQGAMEAHNAIGEMYLGHPDIPEDVDAAHVYFLIGAELDDSRAMYNLGSLYLTGRGVARNEIEGYKWIELSAQMGIGDGRERALRTLSMLRESLTPLQVKAAMASAHVWHNLQRGAPR